MHRPRSHDTVRRRAVPLAVALAVAVTLGAACTSEPAAEVDPVSYRADVEAICVRSSADQATLTQPDDPADVATFALEVARLLEAEAEALRTVTPPPDLAADHRALLQNTDDQARRWAALSSTPADDAAAFGAIQTEILQLSLGRDDLADAMGIARCRRSAP